METEDSSPCSQDAATGSYLVPHESNPQPHTLFLSGRN